MLQYPGLCIMVSHWSFLYHNFFLSKYFMEISYKGRESYTTTKWKEQVYFAVWNFKEKLIISLTNKQEKFILAKQGCEENLQAHICECSVHVL